MKKENTSDDNQKIGSKFGKRRNKKGGEEDESPLRTWVREFIEGKFITIIMSMTTLYALFGDDLRLWFTTKSVDTYFNASLCVAFMFFTTEILINSCVVDGFKYSFFFWLDIIATFSLIPDILWVMEFIQYLMGLSLSSKSADVIPGHLST